MYLIKIKKKLIKNKSWINPFLVWFVSAFSDAKQGLSNKESISIRM